jgi:Sulfotransferase family
MAAMRAEQGSGAPLQPVFVVGVPRSGTTWVQRLLAEHPDAWPLVETYMFSSQIGLGALLRSLPVPDPEASALELAPAGLGRLFAREELVVELRAIAERWLQRATDPGSRFVIEKSPWHLTDVQLIAELLPDARFVHVVRDGRDVAVSLVAARRSWSAEGDSRPASTVREAAGLWARAMSQGEVARVLVGERLLELRYEDLLRDPRAGCRRLFAHCRMLHDERLVEGAVAATDLERSERPRGEDRPLRGGRTGDWRERFGLRNAWVFERHAGEALRETGYEPDPRWWLRRPLRSRL